MLPIFSRAAIHFIVMVVSVLNFFVNPIFPTSLFPRHANSDAFRPTPLNPSLTKRSAFISIASPISAPE